MITDNPREAKFPVGTDAEVLALGLDPREVRTCAPAIDNVSKGCRFHPRNKKGGGCRFMDYNGMRTGVPTGPENAGLYKIIEETGVWQGFELTCYAIMESLHERMKQGEAIGESYSDPLAIRPGDKIRRIYSEKLHPIRDKECEACIKGDCTKMRQDVVKEITIQPFPRPAERFKHIAFGQQVRDGLAGEKVDMQARIAAMTDHQVEIETARERAPKAPDSPSLAEKLKRG